MYKLTRVIALVLATSMLMSCTPWRKQYLESGIGVLTQDEVTKTLGPPHNTRQLEDGSTVWLYQYSSSSVSGNQYGVSGSSSCAEYVLTFDKEKILRSFRRQGC
jgi:hypothetical protein